MTVKKFWKGYQVCLEDCQRVIKKKQEKHGDRPFLYYDCIESDLKAGLVLINEKWCRLKHKINVGSFDTAAMREDCRDMINYTAFLYSLVWNIKERERIESEEKKLDDYLTREYRGL